MTDKLLKISQRLIKWDTDFPVNSHNGYSGLKELDAIIADAKVAVHDAGASYEDDFGKTPAPENHVTGIKRIEWERFDIRSRWSGLTGHYDIKFDRHEWVLDYQAPGKTASFIIGRFSNRTTAEAKAQEIHGAALAQYIVTTPPETREGRIALADGQEGGTVDKSNNGEDHNAKT